MKKFQNTLQLVKNFFDTENIEFWIEAGTALGVYRDKQILPWDHDIDIAIWYDSVPSEKKFEHFFSQKGYQVIFQKGFVYLDNIIQLKRKNCDNNEYIDIDIYLYKETDNTAVMRWINSPIGFLAKTKQSLLYGFNKFLNLKKENIIINKIFFKNFIFLSLFKLFLYIYIHTTYCYSHTFPKKYFKELTVLQIYGVSIKIPKDIESFLEFRYGKGWKIKDQNYNQKGSWKKAEARKKQLMNFIPMPDFRK
tara:strand:+ start:1427 stop:2176 length:750 start_codon:yes stop_codon:yes gene_type:complete